MANDGIKVHIYGDYDDKQVNKAIRDLQGLKTNAAGATPAMGGLNKAMIGLGAAAAGAFSIGMVTDFLKDAAGAAIEDEKSVVALSKAMDNLGLSAQTNGMEQFARDTMLATGTADDLIRNGLQKLVTATGDVKQAQDLLSLSMDISAATGKELSAVTQAMARASTGQVSALTRLGIPLDANIIKTKDFAAATEVLSSKFSGQAAAAADTYGGRMKIMSAAVDEAKETIGYALLGALSDATEALGGEGGMSDAITVAGELAAGLVTGLGGMVTGLIELKGAAKDAKSEDEGLGGLVKTLFDVSDTAARIAGPFGIPIQIMRQAAMQGLDTNAALKELTEGFNGLYGTAAQGEQSLARAEINLRGIASGADDATMSVDEMTDAVKEFKDAISLSQSMDDFREDLRNIGEDLKGSATTIFGPAGKDVRDKAREIFGQIPTIVQQMVDQGKIAQGDFQSTVDSMARQALTSFAKNKVKRQDLENWLGEQGIWSDPAKARAKQVAIDAAAAATKAGQDLGADLARGIPVGLLSQTKPVQAAGMRLIAQAEAAMRLAAESQSPSKLTARVGEDLSKGVAVGVLAATGAVTDASRQMIRDAIDAAKSERDAAMAAMRGVSDSIVGQVLGNVGFSTTDAEGNALTPQQIVASILGSTANQQAAVTAIATNIGAKLPPELLAKMLQMPPETAVALANYLGGAEGSAMLAQLTTNYATLATETETLLGGPMGLAWGKVGDQSARDMLIAARATIAELAPGFANFVRSQLSVGADVVASITGVAEGIAGKRAAGGPVSGGSTYLVGERGPELVTMGGDGFVTPNHALGGRGGNTYAVSVYVAPGGDLAGAGRQMVEAIRAYERSSGKVYASA
jgi:hypothetical protein